MMNKKRNLTKYLLCGAVVLLILASAAFCGKNNSVLVSDTNRSVVDSFVKPNATKISTGYVFGGTGSVSDASKAALEAATK